MKKSRFNIDQIIRILAEAPGDSGAATARKYGVAEQTIYRWRQKYKGFSASEAKRLKLYFDTFLRGGELYLANALRLLVKKIIENHFPLRRWKWKLLSCSPRMMSVRTSYYIGKTFLKNKPYIIQ